LAGPLAPAAPRGTDADSRRRCRDAWMGWWRDHADAADLAKPPEPPRDRGDTLLLQMELDSLRGELVEVKRGGNARPWLSQLRYPIALQPLGDGRLLVAEYATRQVTEYDRGGGEKWQYRAPAYVVSAQRPGNGRGSAACRNRLLEVDEAGKEVLSLTRPQRDVASAREFVNGQFAVVTLTGLCQHLDREGKELRQFPVGQVVVGVGIDVLP